MPVYSCSFGAAVSQEVAANGARPRSGSGSEIGFGWGSFQVMI